MRFIIILLFLLMTAACGTRQDAESEPAFEGKCNYISKTDGTVHSEVYYDTSCIALQSKLYQVMLDAENGSCGIVKGICVD